MNNLKLNKMIKKLNEQKGYTTVTWIIIVVIAIILISTCAFMVIKPMSIDTKEQAEKTQNAVYKNEINTALSKLSDLLDDSKASFSKEEIQNAIAQLGNAQEENKDNTTTWKTGTYTVVATKKQDSQDEYVKVEISSKINKSKSGYIEITNQGIKQIRYVQ